MDIQRLMKSIKAHEGFHNEVYSDSVGIQSIGIGHRIMPGDPYREGETYDEGELQALFRKDVQNAINRTEELLGGLEIKEEAKEIIVEMVFQLGKTGVSEFENMWAALAVGDYTAAAHAMLDSRWHEQTPERAKTLAERMEKLG